MDSAELSSFSEHYLHTTPLEHRKQFGQYFTNYNLRLLTTLSIPSEQSGSWLVAELGCGSGEFIDAILNRFPNAVVDGIEVEPVLAEHCESRFPNNPQVSITCDDVLTHDFSGKTYDLVIGNPPYFEFNSKTQSMTKELELCFVEVIHGRPNIYSFFIKIGIDILKVGGYLAFVVPTSMLNGAYFAKLREYIIAHCSIENIILSDEFQFVDALQNVMVLVLRKGPNDGRFVFSHNGITVFSPQWLDLRADFSGSTTLEQLGFVVKTGTVVWNQHKEKLSNDPSDTLLVWADNITPSGFSLSNHNASKPQYIRDWTRVETKPVIAVNRITGVGSKATLRACLVTAEKPFACENHVNVIFPGTAKISLKELLPHLQNPRAIEVLRKITGNTQISKTELTKLFPIWMA